MSWMTPAAGVGLSCPIANMPRSYVRLPVACIRERPGQLPYLREGCVLTTGELPPPSPLGPQKSAIATREHGTPRWRGLSDEGFRRFTAHRDQMARMRPVALSTR